MKLKINNVLAAKILFFCFFCNNAFAGIPVIDGTSLVQNVITALESVNQTSKQIEQYQTQLGQYENQLKNSVAPSAYIWDQAQQTINNLTQATNTLQYYENNLGSIEAYIDKFHNASYYRSSPCYSSEGCSATQRELMEKQRLFASESQKRANDAMFKGLAQQQDSLKADSRNLERLQSNAQGAKGQLEAIGYANQLASNQSNQLLQIRGLMMAQQTAIATRMQAQADREAQEQASSEQLRKGGFVKSPNKEW